MIKELSNNRQWSHHTKGQDQLWKFVGVVLDANITVNAMQFFGMAKSSDTPTFHVFQGDLSTKLLWKRTTIFQFA